MAAMKGHRIWTKQRAWPAVLPLGLALLCGCGQAANDGDGSGGAPSGGGTGGSATPAGSGGAAGLDGTGGSGGTLPFEGPCSRDLVGDVVIQGQAELDAIQDVCSIDGDLSIHAGVVQVELPRLEVVTGRMVVPSNSTLTELRLPALRSLGDPEQDGTGLLLGEAPFVTSVDMPALVTTGTFTVFATPRLAELELSSLALAKLISIAGTNLARLDLPALTSGYMILNTNEALEAVDGPLWTSGSLEVRDCSSLTALSFPTLTSADSIYLTSGDALTSVSFPVLESLSGRLVVVTHTALEELTFPALTATPWIEVRSNDALASVSFPVLETMADDWLEISANPSLETISVPVLVLGAEPWISDNPLLTVCDGAALADVPDCQ